MADTGIQETLENIETDPDRAIDIFRIMQESLTNIHRHAQATEVEVGLHKQGKSLVLRISDNGKGFDMTNPKKQDSFGILGIKERVLFWQGELEIKSSLAEGTEILLRLPISGKQDA